MALLRRHVGLALILGASLITTGVALASTVIMLQQRDRPALWFIVALACRSPLDSVGWLPSDRDDARCSPSVGSFFWCWER